MSVNQSSKKHLSLDLLYTGFYKVERWWNFKNLVSPFYRLLLITKRECNITINQTDRYTLKRGDLFLVPKFELIDYECTDYMEHYYICPDEKLPSVDPQIYDNNKTLWEGEIPEIAFLKV